MSNLFYNLNILYKRCEFSNFIFNIFQILTFFKNMINTFASERHHFEKKRNEPYCLENASNLMLEFLYEFFKKKIYQNLSYKKAFVNFDAFLKKMAKLFFSKIEVHSFNM